MLSLKTKKTYSISKLLQNFDKLIDETLSSSAKDTEDQSKMNIDNSRTKNDTPMKSLHKSTLRLREDGVFWAGEFETKHFKGGKSVTPIYKKENLKALHEGSSMPLLYTGSLRDSIKAKDKRLSLNKYGMKHNEGYDATFGGTKTVTVPKRPFLEFTIGEKTKNTFKDLLKKYLKK